MLATADDAFASPPVDDERSVRIVRSEARWGSVLAVVAATATVLSLCGGMFLLTTQAMSKPDAVSLALAQPLATLQIVAGLMLLSSFVLVPVHRLIAGLGRVSIEIDGSTVRVAERGLFSSRTFQEPLGAYRGTAHRVRTTLSGLRHEIVLVHPDKRRDVILALDRLEPSITPGTMVARLGLPEIAAGEMARRR